MIVCEIGNKSHELSYLPSKEITIKIMDDIVNKSCQRICNKHKQIIQDLEYKEYTKHDIDNDGQDEILEIQQLLYKDENFKEI